MTILMITRVTARGDEGAAALRRGGGPAACRAACRDLDGVVADTRVLAFRATTSQRSTSTPARRGAVGDPLQLLAVLGVHAGPEDRLRGRRGRRPSRACRRGSARASPPRARPRSPGRGASPCWKPIAEGVPCRRTVIQPLRAPAVREPASRGSSAAATVRASVEKRGHGQNCGVVTARAHLEPPRGWPYSTEPCLAARGGSRAHHLTVVVA